MSINKHLSCLVVDAHYEDRRYDGEKLLQDEMKGFD